MLLLSWGQNQAWRLNLKVDGRRVSLRYRTERWARSCCYGDSFTGSSGLRRGESKDTAVAGTWVRPLMACLLHTWCPGYLCEAEALLCAKMLQSYPTLCDLWTVGRFLCPWDSPGKNTGVGYGALLRGSNRPRNLSPASCISCMGRQVLYH